MGQYQGIPEPGNGELPFRRRALGYREVAPTGARGHGWPVPCCVPSGHRLSAPERFPAVSQTPLNGSSCSEFHLKSCRKNNQALLILVTWVEEKNKTTFFFFNQKNILSRFLHWLQVVLHCLHSAMWFLLGDTRRIKAARSVGFHHRDEHPYQRSSDSFSVEPHMALLGQEEHLYCVPLAPCKEATSTWQGAGISLARRGVNPEDLLPR